MKRPTTSRALAVRDVSGLNADGPDPAGGPRSRPRDTVAQCVSWLSRMDLRGLVTLIVTG